MERKRIVFVYSYMVVGGVFSLVLRLTKHLTRFNYDVVVCYKEIDEISNESFTSEKISVFKYDKIRDIQILAEDSAFIVFEIDVYLELLNNKKRFKDSEFFLYVIHPFLFRSFEGAAPIYRRIIKNDMKHFVEKAIESKNIFFMDFECLKATFEHFEICFNEENAKNNIIHLIIDIPEKEEIIPTLERQKNYSLLTIARSDFPFKGYLIGIVDTYKQLVNAFHNCSLTIISTGPHLALLKDKIKESPNGINLVEGADYSSLTDYYDSCSVYIGMGTTILEAAARGKIAIPVESYTYSCNSCGFFSDNPEWIAATHSANRPIVDDIKRAFCLSDELFLSKSLESYESVKRIYSPSSVLDSLFKLFKSCIPFETKKYFPKKAFFLKRIRNIFKKI